MVTVKYHYMLSAIVKKKFLKAIPSADKDVKQLHS